MQEVFVLSLIDKDDSRLMCYQKETRSKIMGLKNAIYRITFFTGLSIDNVFYQY
jgi:hypothetical protein